MEVVLPYEAKGLYELELVAVSFTSWSWIRRLPESAHQRSSSEYLSKDLWGFSFARERSRETVSGIHIF